MKTSVIVLMTLIGSISNSTAQTSTTIYTPKGSSLTAWNEIPEMSDDDKSDWSDWVAYYYPDADEINAPSATTSYNCHAFAWHVSEGGSNVWIGLGGYDANYLTVEDIYWTDGSYSETTEPYASKISYYSDNHSAIQTSTQGTYRSKWGPGPLMEHTRAYGPAEYQMSYRKYYKLRLSTSGSTAIICNDVERTFSSNISISGSTYTWSRSTSYLDYVSGSGTTSYTVEGNGNPGDAWVGLQITTPSGEVAIAPNKNFWAGKAQVQSISGPSSTSRYAYNYYYANTNHASGTTYDWMVSPSGPYLSPSGGEVNSALVIFYTNGSYQVLAHANNVCGTTTWCPKSVYVGGKSLSLYPNPAKESVTITINEDTVSDLIADTELNRKGVTEKNQIKEPVNYTIRIFNNQSILQSTIEKSGKNFTIPLNNLRDGIYFIEVSDGSNRYTHQLVIKQN